MWEIYHKHCQTSSKMFGFIGRKYLITGTVITILWTLSQNPHCIQHTGDFESMLYYINSIWSSNHLVVLKACFSNHYSDDLPALRQAYGCLMQRSKSNSISIMLSKRWPMKVKVFTCYTYVLFLPTTNISKREESKNLHQPSW
jgi:hypothetical protein